MESEIRASPQSLPDRVIDSAWRDPETIFVNSESNPMVQKANDLRGLDAAATSQTKIPATSGRAALAQGWLGSLPAREVSRQSGHWQQVSVAPDPLPSVEAGRLENLGIPVARWGDLARQRIGPVTRSETSPQQVEVGRPLRQMGRKHGLGTWNSGMAGALGRLAKHQNRCPLLGSMVMIERPRYSSEKGVQGRSERSKDRAGAAIPRIVMASRALLWGEFAAN